MKRMLPLAALLAAACAAVRVSGGGPPPEPLGEPRELAEPKPRPAAALPEPSPAQRETAVFYSDLGPEELDLSSYPLQQRSNYRVYARACASCHALSRSLYAPVATRGWWEFYVMGMRLRGRLAGAPLTKEEVAAVLDFLEYDGRERKLGRAREFEAQTEELKRRFDGVVAERMERLQRQRGVLGR